MICVDSNGTKLSVNDAVMYIDSNGGEWKGTVIELIDDNKIKISCETGDIIIDAAMVFVLP